MSTDGRSPLDYGIALLSGADFWRLPAVPELGVSEIVMSDGPAGVRGVRWDERDTSINVPSPTALSSSWNRELVRSIGGLLAAEARRKNVHVLLAPTINLHRTPYGGRYFECFSEDPILTAEIAGAYIEGVQGGGVAATAKHYVANDTETERFTVDVRVAERVLREVYLLPFELLMRRPPWVIMAAYNSVNGSTMTENPLLEDPLRVVWHWDGAVVSDWFAARDTVRAARGGLDIAMPAAADGPWGDRLRRAVADGRVPSAEVHRKIDNVVRLAERVGRRGEFGLARNTVLEADAPELLRRAAAEGSVLLKNDGDLLPFVADHLDGIAVIGPNARLARTLGGGSATVFPPHTISPADGIVAALGPQVRVSTAVGSVIAARVPRLWEHGSRHPVDDVPGMRLRLLADDGSVLVDETRSGETFGWLGDFPANIDGRAVATIQVDAVVTVADEEYEVGSAGVGGFRLVVDDEVLFDEFVTIPPESDPVTATLLPPQRVVTRRWVNPTDCVISLTRRVAVDESSIRFDLLFGAVAASDEELLAEAEQLARENDVVVLVVGTTEEVETEGLDRQTLALPGNQDELVRRVVAANPRTAVVLNSGAPVLLPWRHDVPAILQTWFGGQESGAALADMLFGVREPGGRLPSAWPASERGLPSPVPIDGVLEYEREPVLFSSVDGIDIDYACGHGLGYTRFELTGEPTLRFVGGVPRIDVHVRNETQREGKCIVQAYAARTDRSPRKLAGFTTAFFAPGESRQVTVELELAAFCEWRPAERDWFIPSGERRVECGWSAADTPRSVVLPFARDVSLATVGARLAVD